MTGHISPGTAHSGRSDHEDSLLLKARDGGPVWFDAELRAWLVAGFREAKQALESEAFSSGLYEVLVPDIARANDIMTAEGEKHRHYRIAFGRAFSRARLAGLVQEVFDPAARRLAETLATGVVVDLHREFIRPYYRDCIFHLVGVTESVGDELVATVTRTRQFFADEGVESVRGFAAVELLHERVQTVCTGTVGDIDSMSLIPFLRAASADIGMSLDELSILTVSFFDTLVESEGRNRTPNLQDAGVSVLRLIADLPAPKQRLLASSDEMLLRATDEGSRLQRWSSVPRLTVRHTELGGRAMAPGEPVFVLIGEANRDPSMFEDPEVFNPWRHNVEHHLGFGAGAHNCIGRGFGRLITARACGALLDKFTIRTNESGDSSTMLLATLAPHMN